MKKIALSLLSTILLCSCADNSNSPIANTGNNIINNYVDTQCRTELNKRKEWQLTALLLTEEKQKDWENKICGCASEEAIKNVSLADTPKLLTENGRNELLASIATKTISTCVQRLFKNN